ncbi:MAG TPA: FecR domain-containing protein [Gammaproteobacteria bacterium]|nr:FecR domain-containing protein [Gammaproteobacteria bacterium]
MIKQPSLVLAAALGLTLNLSAQAAGTLSASTPASSNPPVGSVVTAVQSPAWLVHAGSTAPLKPGMQVGDGDMLRTASGGRVYISLPEHSTVKLGENTEFATPTLQMAHDQQGSMFKSVLHVLKGVFRFTTSLIGKSERRQVDIQVGTATIGLRGTDVWGRAGTDGSLVALLEGKISMDMPGHATMMMEQPMHYMTMATGGTDMKMNMPVTQDNVADWAAQTDVAAGSGVLTDDGKWVVALVSSTSDADTARLMKKLADAGYPSEDVEVTVKGKQWHRLVIRQVASLEDAKALADKVAKVSPLMSPWPYQPK